MSKEFDEFMNNVAKLGNEDVPKLGCNVEMTPVEQLKSIINRIESRKMKEQSNDDNLEKLAEEHIAKHHLNHSYTTSKFSFKEGYKTKDTQIPNDEIFKAALDYDNMTSYSTPIGHFQMGAFWYREQLKTKKND